MRIHRARSCRLSLALLILPALCACGTVPSKDWSPTQADLLLSSNRGGNSEIYLIRGGTAEWINLTRSEARENWPVWSPDGSQIAYQRRAPKGSDDDQLDIWVMNADGSNPRPLTNNPAHDYLPAWSPDGQQLSFASWRTEPGDTGEAAVHIYVMNADGSGQRRLFADSLGLSGGAEWAADGQRFLVSRKTSDQSSQIQITDGAGNTNRRLTRDQVWAGAPVFSPSGSRIAFYVDDGERSDIAVMNVDGTYRRTVLEGGKHYYPRWSPDGRWLICTTTLPDDAEGDLSLIAVPVDGSAAPITLVSGGGRNAEGAWRPVPPGQ
jgi:TolB protein